MVANRFARSVIEFCQLVSTKKKERLLYMLAASNLKESVKKINK